jgi:hypothetical protein
MSAQNKPVDYTKFVEPRFQFHKLKTEDFRDEPDWKDPWYRLRQPIEPEKLQQIYQQAFIYDLLYRFAKEHLPSKNDQTKDQSECVSLDKATDTKIDRIRDKVLDYLFKNEIKVESKSSPEETGITKPNETLRVDGDLWSTDDLNILRKRFDRIKDENMALKTRLALANEEIKSLNDKYEKLAMETKSLPSESRSLEKANQRMYVRVQQVEQSYRANLDDVFELDKTCKIARDEALEARKKCQVLLHEKSRLEYELQKYEQGARRIKSELRLEFKERLEAQKLKFTKEISLLAKQNGTVSRDLQEEKTEHERCRRALEQLRIHFMSVSFSQANLNNRIDDSKIQMI